MAVAIIDQCLAKAGPAVAHFWATRQAQGRNQGRQTGRRDAGQRTAVTGGKQLDGFVELVRCLLEGAGLTSSEVHVNRAGTVLPGYFRPTKQWDIVAVVGKTLVAGIEFKSQVGPSFGNNFNNRSEEAVGSAHDLWTAYREKAFQAEPPPWLGYLMLLEDCDSSRSPIAVAEPHFEVFPEFRGASYARRYALLGERLVRERLYTAACLLLSDVKTGATGKFSEPSDALTMRKFAASLFAHAASIAMTR